MRYSLLLLIVLNTGAFSVAAQQPKKNMPSAAAITAFEKTFPGAAKVQWDKEKKDYEAEFVWQGKQMAAVYSNAGVLKETEEDIAIGELPDAVTGYVKQHYAKVVIAQAAKVTTPTGEVKYEAEVNKMDLIFDVYGKFIRKVKDAD